MASVCEHSCRFPEALLHEFHKPSGQFSAGVGQGPQTPALPHTPIPVTSLYSLSNGCSAGGRLAEIQGVLDELWRGSPADQPVEVTQVQGRTGKARKKRNATLQCSRVIL
jgi:hypothetical protein